MDETEKPSILIVDDRPENLLALERVLETLPLNIIRAESGNEALALLLKYDFALVLLDVQMPDMDGFETAELMRGIKETKQIPIIFVTAISKEQNHIFKGYETGAVDYLFKPLDPIILKSKVNVFLELNKQKKSLEKTSRDLRQIVRQLKIEIAERKRAEKEKKRYTRDLEIAKNYTENIIESMIDTLIVVDPKGKITAVNLAALDLLEYREEELIGQSVRKILADETSLKVSRSAKIVTEGAIRDHDTTYRTKSGKNIPVLFAGSVMRDADDNLLGVVGVARDMRESRLVKELEKANKELKETAAQLIQSEKLSALGELTAGVAHEMNQPLNGIKIISQSILRDIEKNRFEEENIGQDLAEIVNQVNKMAEIIDHMRIYTRQGHVEGVPNEMIDLNTVIKGPFKILGQQLKTQNIEVIMELTPDLPKVVGDQIRLEQVFMNLITNARNAVGSCGKEDKRIEIRTYKIDDRQDLAVEVKDNGEGIPEHLREKIFQPFFTTRDPGKGTGLGLSVSSKIIEEHKGRIELESMAGEGSTFRVILPIEG